MDFVKKVFFKSAFGEMYVFSFERPVDLSRRNLQMLSKIGGLTPGFFIIIIWLLLRVDTFSLTAMKDRNYKIKSKSRRFLRLRWIWVIVGFGLLVPLILILVPFGVDHEIEQYFLANGADQIYLEDVDFNPFTRHLVVKNLIGKVGNEQVLKVSEAGFSFSWSSFFKKKK